MMEGASSTLLRILGNQQLSAGGGLCGAGALARQTLGKLRSPPTAGGGRLHMGHGGERTNLTPTGLFMEEVSTNDDFAPAPVQTRC